MFKWLEEFGINTAIVLTVLGGFLLLVGFWITKANTSTVFAFALGVSPLVLPPALFFIFFE